MNTEKQIAMIDIRVTDYQVLEQAARQAGLEVILLHTDRIDDWVEQAATALKGNCGVEALHILFYHSKGQTKLESAVLTSLMLDHYSDELSIFRRVLSDTSHLLLYGCNAATDDQGQRFIDQLFLHRIRQRLGAHQAQ